MSYRDDHDAALARVDALETELETLRRTPPARPAEAATPPERRSSFAAWAAGIVAVGIAVSGAFIAGGLLHRGGDEPVAAAAEPAPAAPDVTDQLRACRSALAPRLTLGASCRRLLDQVATDVYVDPDLRAEVALWADAETALASATAPADHDRAVTARDAVLHRLAPLL